MSELVLENEKKLPVNWALTNIGTICHDPKYGWTTSASNTGKIKFLRTTDITSGKINWDTVPFCNKIPEVLEKYLLKKNDVVISRAGSIGFSYLLDDVSNTVFASYLIRFRPMINHKFFYYFLQSPFYWKTISEKKVGIAVQNVNATKLKQIMIPLPPLNEQKRIVLKIEKLFSIINNYDSILKQILSKLHQYQNSFLISAFSGTLTQKWRRNNSVGSVEVLIQRIISTRLEQASKASDKKTKKQLIQSAKISVIRKNPKINSWLDVKLENLVYIAGRIGWKGLKAQEYTGNGPLFLSVYQLDDGGVVNFENAYHISKERYDESLEIQLQNNDILLVKDGSGIGKISIVQDIKELATVNSSLLVIRSGKAFIPKFLFYFLYGPELQNIAQQRITGSATPHLFQRDIKKFILSVPPLEEQIEIVKLIENGLTIIQNTHKIILNESKRMNSVKNLILQIAFEGKLLHQDPNDEPAEILLERIKQEKERLEQKQKIIKAKTQKRRGKNVK